MHLMMSASLQHTPLAALSRPVAGTVKNTLVVTLPGSVKAVKENMEALLAGGVVNHAIDLIRGGTGKQVHAALAAEGSHAAAIPGGARHHHHHDHTAPQPRTLSHDPSAAGMLKLESEFVSIFDLNIWKPRRVIVFLPILSYPWRMLLNLCRKISQC